MEPSVVLEVAKQIPALAVLVWLVSYFLLNIKSLINDHREQCRADSKECEDRISGHANDARELTKNLATLVQANTLMLGKLSGKIRDES